MPQFDHYFEWLPYITFILFYCFRFSIHSYPFYNHIGIINVTMGGGVDSIVLKLNYDMENKSNGIEQHHEIWYFMFRQYSYVFSIWIWRVKRSSNWWQDDKLQLSYVTRIGKGAVALRYIKVLKSFRKAVNEICPTKKMHFLEHRYFVGVHPFFYPQFFWSAKIRTCCSNQKLSLFINVGIVGFCFRNLEVSPSVSSVTLI